MNQKEVKKMLRAFECDCGEVIIKDKPQSKALCPKCRHYVKIYVDFEDREEYLNFKEILEDLYELKNLSLQEQKPYCYMGMFLFFDFHANSK